MNTIKTYLLNCSFHGLPFIADVRYHWSERLFWVVSVALSWGAAGYVMLSSYDQFKNSAISFTVSVSYLDWKTNFPAVIFCEKGNFNYHYYAQKWFGNDRDFETDDILKDIIFFKGGLEGISFKCNTESCLLATGNYSFYADSVRSKCNELFEFCSWNNKEFPCCQQILPVKTIYGVCYGINSIFSSVKPQSPLSTIVSYTNISIGILTVELLNPDTKVFILSQEALPLYIEDSSVAMDGTSTSPHYKEDNNVFLSVKEMVNDKDVKKVSVERRRCRFPDENYLENFKAYSFSACIIDCFIDIQIEICNCTHHLMPITQKKKICDMEGLICLSREYDKMMQQSPQCTCDSSCTEAEVKIVGVTTQQNFTEFAHDSSITRINFILPAPTVRYNRVVVNGYLDLIVSMGGTAGLCVGASLLTAVEIFYYFFLRPLDDNIKKNQIKKKRNRKHFKKPPFPFVN